MLIDVQIAAATFCRLLRERLRATPIPLGCDILAGETTEALDRIDILDDTTVRRDPQARQTVWFLFPNNYTSFQLPVMQLRQQVAIRRVKVADLLANGPAPSPHVTPELILTVVFNVWITTASTTVSASNQVLLHAQYDSVDFGIFADLIPAPLRTGLQARLAGLALPVSVIDLGFLAKYTGGTAAAYNAGIACNGDGSMVTLRIELAKNGDFTPTFYTEDADNLLQGAEWAICLDSRLLTAPLAKRIHDELLTTPNVRIDQAPSATWHPAGPSVVVSTQIEAVDACPFFVDDLDMDVAANLSLTFARAPSGALRTRFTMQAGPSDPLEVIACAATASTMWPVIGVALTDKYDLDVGVYFGGLLMPPLARMLAMMLFITSPPIPVSEGSSDHCTKIGDADYQCDEPWNVTLPGLGGNLDLQAVRGIGRGLVLAGRIDQPLPPPEPRILDVVVQPFRWQLEGQCRKPWNIVSKAEIFVAQVPGVRIWSACKANDVHDEFDVSIADQTITVRPRFKPAYVQAPYPLQLRLLTDKGVRTLTLAPPPAITRRQRRQLQIARNRAIASCYSWEKTFTRLERLQWLVDPPPTAVDIVQGWQLAISGLPVDSVLEIGAGRRRLMTARPSLRGVVHATLFTGERGLVPALTLRVVGATERGRPAAMAWQQLLFARVATVAAPAGLAAMHFERHGGALRLVLRGVEQVHELSLQVPAMPVLSSVAAADRREGLVGVHTGRALRSLPTDRLPALLPRRRHRGTEDTVIANPKVGGVAEPWFVGDRDGGVLFDLARRGDDRPFSAHEYLAPPWFADTALAGDLLARRDPADDTIGIWRLAGRAAR